MRFGLAGLLAIALAGFALPTSAAAATRYVATGGSDVTNDCTNPAAPCLTVQHAADAAVDGETVEIEAGTYEESVQVSGKALTFVGEGSGTLEDSTGATIVRGLDGGPGVAGSPAFELPLGGALRSLRAVGGNGGTPVPSPPPGGDAVVYRPTAATATELQLDSVVVVGGAGTFPALGGDGLRASGESATEPVDLGVEGSMLAGGFGLGSAPALRLNGGLVSAEVENSTLDATAPTLSPALSVLGGAAATVDGSRLEAEIGADVAGGSLILHRSVVEGGFTGVEAHQFVGQGGEVEVEDSLVTANGSAASMQTGGVGDPVTLTAQGTTFAGGGAAAVRVQQGSGGPAATATLHNSIARHETDGQVDLLADGGTIEVDFSSFSTTQSENGGNIIHGTGNVGGDPLFVDPAEGDYRLQPGSPLIDAGDPSIVAPRQLDLAGEARSQDGDGDCLIAPDVGAYELAEHSSICTRYVATDGTDGAGCTNPTEPCLTVQHAADQSADGDTVEIEAGTYEESVQTFDKALAFVGEGSGTLEESSGATIVQGPENGAEPAFELPQGGELRQLRAQGGDGVDSGVIFEPGGPGGPAVVFAPNDAEETDLTVDGAVLAGGAGGTGLIFPGAHGDGLVATGTGSAGTVKVTVSEGELAGDVALRLRAAAGTIAGSTLRARGGSLIGGASTRSLAVAEGATAAVEESSLFGTVGVTGRALTVSRSTVLGGGFGGSAVQANQGEASPEAVEVEIEDSLLRSSGVALSAQTAFPGDPVALSVRGSTLWGQGVAAVHAHRDEGAAAAEISLRNSIARNEPTFAESSPADLRANGGAIEADFSSFTDVVTENGGSAPVPGSASNVAGDPRFVDPQPEPPSEGEPPPEPDFRLQPSSPLIDAGDPSIVEPGQFGLGGNARSLDGDEDCVAAPDIGAYELAGFEAACPTSGGDGDDGGGDSRSSSAPPPQPIPPLPAPIDSPPVIEAFKVTNKKFAPAGRRRARSSAAIKRGTRFLYRLSEAARVVLVVKGGKRRVRLQRRQGAGRRSIPFSGRKRGKPLPPGRYVARIVAIDSAGQRSRPRQLVLRIRRG